MNTEERIKMFKDVFKPISGESVLIIIDKPHGSIKDNENWVDRREMAKEWYISFKEFGKKSNFSVDLLEYNATGMHNNLISNDILNIAKKYNIVIAMTEYSASSSLIPICQGEGSITRCASMPTVERRMEKTAFKADYTLVQKNAIVLENMLNNAIGAEVSFSTEDKLFLDLRNRKAKSDKGDCSKKGQSINFPSGEACKVPYESVGEEKKYYGKSKTNGVLPVDYNGEIVKFQIKENRINKIVGDGNKAQEMEKFFEKNESRRNIAELGIGCNPNAVVTGNILEDEKVGGLHIAYGMSNFLGGKVESDVHQDICYPKGAPIEAKSLILICKDGSKIEIIKDALLQYNLLG